MKKLRNIMLLVAALGMATLFTGCGDDDDNDNDNGGPTIFAPLTAADLQSATKIYTVNVDGNQVLIKFPQAQQYTADDESGTQHGITSAPQRNGNVWTFNITPDAGQTNALAGTVELNFTSANAGTYKLTETGSGEVHNGTFTVQDTGGETNGGTTDGTNSGTTDGTNGGTTDGTNGGTNGGNANDLTGKVLQFNYTPSGGDKFTFETANSGQWENDHPMTYTYDASTHHFTANVPDTGDNFNVTLMPTSETAGTADVDVNGTTYPANYTLQ